MLLRKNNFETEDTFLYQMKNLILLNLGIC